MNILVVGKFHVEGFALHIGETLSDMGHMVHRFDPGPPLRATGRPLAYRINQLRQLVHSTIASVPTFRAQRMGRLWRLGQEYPVDLVIVCHDFLWPEEVKTLKRSTNARVVLWFPDPIAFFGSANFINAPYDALFFKDPYIVYKL